MPRRVEFRQNIQNAPSNASGAVSIGRQRARREMKMDRYGETRTMTAGSNCAYLLSIYVKNYSKLQALR